MSHNFKHHVHTFASSKCMKIHCVQNQLCSKQREHYHPRVRGGMGRENQMISITRIFPLGQGGSEVIGGEIASKTTDRETRGG